MRFTKMSFCPDCGKQHTPEESFIKRCIDCLRKRSGRDEE